MRRFRTVFVGLFVLTVSLAAALPAGADALLTVDPSTDVAQIGDTVTFEFLISDVTDLYSFQFDVGYDPTVFSLSSQQQGSFLGGPAVADFIPGGDETLGTISMVFGVIFGDVTGVSGSGSLAALTFTVIGLADPSFVTVSNVFLLDSTLQAIAAGTANGSVSTVPEPSSLALMGLGLATWYGRRRFRRRDDGKNIRSTV